MNNDKAINIEDWNTDDWEKYLSSIESPQRERLLERPSDVENLSSDYYMENFSSLIGQNYTPQLKELCADILDMLTPHQQRIITELYWNNKTVVELTKELGLSRAAIRHAKDRAEIQMKKRLLNLQENQNRKNEKTDQEAS